MKTVFSFGGLFVLLAAAAAGCSEVEKPPTIADIRQAYSLQETKIEFEDSPLFEDAPQVSIPDQVPECTPEGDLHFDCKFEVSVARDGSQSREYKRGHVWNDEGTWHIAGLID